MDEVLIYVPLKKRSAAMQRLYKCFFSKTY